jgi:hypothetical protein
MKRILSKLDLRDRGDEAGFACEHDGLDPGQALAGDPVFAMTALLTRLRLGERRPDRALRSCPRGRI